VIRVNEVETTLCLSEPITCGQWTSGHAYRCEDASTDT
jgi:hypothetical protein